MPRPLTPEDGFSFTTKTTSQRGPLTSPGKETPHSRTAPAAPQPLGGLCPAVWPGSGSLYLCHWCPQPALQCPSPPHIEGTSLRDRLPSPRGGRAHSGLTPTVTLQFHPSSGAVLNSLPASNWPLAHVHLAGPQQREGHSPPRGSLLTGQVVFSQPEPAGLSGA